MDMIQTQQNLSLEFNPVLLFIYVQCQQIKTHKFVTKSMVDFHPTYNHVL